MPRIRPVRTKEEAEKWMERHLASYMQGPNGYISLHIENWNEDRQDMGVAPGIMPPGSIVS